MGTEVKFGFHTIHQWDQPLPDVVDEISRAGFKGFETFSWDLRPFFREKRSFLDLLSDKGIQLASIYTYGRHILFDGSLSGIRAYFWWWWRSIPRVLEFAAFVGCNRIVVGGDQRLRRKTKEKDIVEMARSLNKIGKKCNEYGVEATYHFFHPGYIIKDRSLLGRLCELTDPDLVHLTIDIGHLIWAGIDPIDIIHSYKDRIDLVHFKNLKNRKYVEFGDKGTVDFTEIMHTLRSIGYTDWIIIDNESVSSTIFGIAVKARDYINRFLVPK